MALVKYVAPAFLCGLLFGVGFAFMLVYSESIKVGSLWWSTNIAHEISRKDYQDDVQMQKTIVRTAADYAGTLNTTSPQSSPFADRHDNVTAQQLFDKVRVLCWIMTSPTTLQKKAKHVRDTWSKRCNIRLFMSSVEDKEFPAVGLPLKEGRDQLYEKTKASYRYAWEHYKDKADWFMKADDDTFVVVENLRFLLKDYDPSKPIYFGRKFKPFVKQGYMSGGAGYVLSKEALRRFIEGLDSRKCHKGGGVEDVEMGRCMSEVGVQAGDSRDAQQREAFHPLAPKHHLISGVLPDNFWIWRYNYYPMCAGPTCSSNYPITFHYVSADDMYIFEYFIYNVQVYGQSHMYQRYSKLPYEN